MLTQEYLKSILNYDEDTGNFIRLVKLSNNSKIGEIAGAIDEKGYRRIYILGKYIRGHKLAWFYNYGVWPKDQLDHINNVKDDNRLCNLRECSNRLNQFNTKVRKNSKTGVKGVHPQGNGFEADIKINGKTKYIGYFSNIADAKKARDKVAIEIHGDYFNAG